MQLKSVSYARVYILQDLSDSLADTGANASAEEADEGVEDGAVQVNNVVNSFRLSQTSFDKKSYLSHLKGRPDH